MKGALLRDFSYIIGLVVGTWMQDWLVVGLFSIWLAVYRFWQWRKIESEPQENES